MQRKTDCQRLVKATSEFFNSDATKLKQESLNSPLHLTPRRAKSNLEFRAMIDGFFLGSEISLFIATGQQRHLRTSPVDVFPPSLPPTHTVGKTQHFLKVKVHWSTCNSSTPYTSVENYYINSKSGRREYGHLSTLFCELNVACQWPNVFTPICCSAF